MTEAELRAFNEGMVFELYAMVEREYREHPSDDVTQRLGRAFRETFSRIDFAAVTIEPSDEAKDTLLYKEPSRYESVITFAGIAMRFGAFLAAQGIGPGEETFSVRSDH